MARGINKVILIGNLGQDPDTRFTAEGSAITNLSLATDESYKDKQTGQVVPKTEWHKVVLFNRLAEIARDYLKKGSKVYIEGRLQTRKWQDQSGQDRYTTEIVGNELQMLDSREGANGQGAPQQQPQQPQRQPQQQQPQHHQQRPGQTGGNQGYAQPPRSPMANNPRQQGPAPQQPPSQHAGGGNYNDFDDDIPFEKVPSDIY